MLFHFIPVSLLQPVLVAFVGFGLYYKGRHCENRLDASHKVGWLVSTCITSSVVIYLLYFKNSKQEHRYIFAY